MLFLFQVENSEAFKLWLINIIKFTSFQQKNTLFLVQAKAVPHY